MTEGNPHIVDVSLSSFESELASVILQEHGSQIPVVIYFERGYAIAEERLRLELRKEARGLPITSQIYDGDEAALKPEGGAIVVYLGSPELFETFRRLTEGHDYHRLYVPNWIRPVVDPSGPEPANRNYVVIASTLEALMQGRERDWNELLSIILHASENDQDVHAALSSRLIDRRTTVQVGF